MKRIQIFKVKKCQKNASYECLSLIMLDSVIRVNKKYCPQTLSEECKYEIKKNKMENLINDDLDLSSSDNELIVRLIMMNLMNRLLKVNNVF